MRETKSRDGVRIRENSEGDFTNINSSVFFKSIPKKVCKGVIYRVGMVNSQNS